MQGARKRVIEDIAIEKEGAKGQNAFLSFELVMGAERGKKNSTSTSTKKLIIFL